ncbi:MAG: AraC family transcriptional regulator [Prevotella sp.]|nr:AraC family transcriptional regulator [Prevotella sp.]
MMPLNYIMTVENVSLDYDSHILTFKFASAEYAGLIGFSIMHLTLADDERRIVESFYRLIAELANYRTTTSSDVEHLIVSLLFFVKKVYNLKQGKGDHPLMSASEALVNNFLQLLAESGAPHRHVEYYAERLHVSVNHLQTTVKRQTNLTVMQWVNNKTIVMIQGYLRDKNHVYSLAEITDMMNFGDETSLSRFFKKETGLTPSEYRKQSKE